MSQNYNPVLSGAVTSVLIIALVLAGLGVLTHLGSLIMIPFSESMMTTSMPLPPGPEAESAIQAFKAAYRKTVILGMPVALVKLILSALIIWSTIGVFRHTPKAQSRLSRWFLIALILELPTLGLGLLAQSILYQPTQDYYRIAAPQLAQMGSLSIVMGAVIGLVLSTAKIAFFVFGRKTLNKTSLSSAA